MSSHQRNLFLFTFSKHPVALSEKFFPLDWFCQERSLGLLIHVIIFLREFVTTKVEFAPFELFTQTSCLIPLIEKCFNYSRFLSWEKIR